jgi:hypothetical protein
MSTGRFEIRVDEETGRRYWWGAEDGWKDATEIGVNGVLTLDAAAFEPGTVLELHEDSMYQNSPATYCQRPKPRRRGLTLKILAALTTQPQTTNQIAGALELDRNTVAVTLSRLARSGEILSEMIPNPAGLDGAWSFVTGYYIAGPEAA